jgi:capsular exopolysaccharide synthesis family protein
MKPKKLNLGEILRKISEEERVVNPGPAAPKTPQNSTAEPTPAHETILPAAPPSTTEQSVYKATSLYSRESPRELEKDVRPVNRTDPLPDPEMAPAGADRVIPPTMPLPDSIDNSGNQPYAPRNTLNRPERVPRQPVFEHRQGMQSSSLKKEETNETVEFDIFRYIGVILHRKNIVIFSTFLLTLLSVFQYMKGEKDYVTHARLLFKPAEKEMTGELVSTSIVNRDKLFNTHLELLKSNTVLTIVADNLGNRVQLGQIKGNLIIAQGVTNRDKNDIIELTYKNRNPELARDVLNELCKTYIDYRLEVNSQEETRLLYKFDVQINKLQQELDQKEGDLRRFKESNRMVELSSEANLTSTKLSNMEISLQETQLALVESKDKLTSLTSQIGKQDLDIVQSMTYSDPIKQKLSALELEYNQLSAENSPEHFKVKMIRQQIEKLKAAVADSITQEAASKTLVKNPLRQSLISDYINLSIEQSALEAKRIALEKVIEGLNADLLKLPAIEQKYTFLQRETEAILQTLRLLKTKYEEAKIKRDSQETDIKILELAELPRAAISTVKPSSILLGLLIGLILGIAIAFLLEYLDQSVKDPLQVERVLNLPLLGVVPLIQTDTALIQKTGDLKKTVLEPFRTLRANIKHLASTYNYHTFMMCSAIKGEGKTTLAANLAITFALDGKKVIIVDADLRRSQLHTLFSMPKEVGLSDYLLETKTIDEIIKPTVYENLQIITSGERPHNPAELIGTMRFDLLIQQLRKRADFVLFDSPALLPVSDGLSMAPKMDSCIMAFRTMWTPLKAARQAKDQILRVGTHILGGIFNGVSQSRGYYPYYYGYYGYYSYTKYSYDEEPKRKFSMRETGLIIEDGVKKGLHSLRNALPRFFSSVKSFTKELVKKKFFWLLLIVFLGLSAVEFWLQVRPAPERTDEEGIVYLGVGGAGGQASPVQKSPVDTVHGSSDSGATGSQKAITGLGLRDSVAKWFAAKKSNNIATYLGFYDSIEFKSIDGGYNELRLDAYRKDFIDTSINNIVIDSIWQGFYKMPYLETMVQLRSANGPDTIHAVVDMIWKKGKTGWRIVGEKK